MVGMCIFFEKYSELRMTHMSFLYISMYTHKHMWMFVILCCFELTTRPMQEFPLTIA